MRYLKTHYRLLKHTVVVPIISSVIIPIVIMDIWIEIYHRTCFSLCNIPYVKRSEYIQIDRHKLSYLNWLQKIYCVYCGYGNGAMRYWARIAAETEQYWCGIKHKSNPHFFEPEHHKNFTEYGDKERFEEKYK